MLNYKCENCGAKLTFNRITNTYNCENCGSEFSFNDNSLTENSHVGAGLKFLELKEFENACECFNNALKTDPNNAIAWLGLAKAKTKNFTFLTKDIVLNVEKCFKNAKAFATQSEEKNIKMEYSSFCKLLNTLTISEQKSSQLLNYNTGFTIASLVCFVLMAIINLYFTIISDSSLIWKILDFIIITLIELFVMGIYFAIMKATSPKKNQLIFIHAMFFSIVIIILFIVDIGIAKTI